MAKRAFRKDDAYRLKMATDLDLSPDGRLVSWVQAEVDQESDMHTSSVVVAPLDGSEGPRLFSDGPLDQCPRFSPDGRHLAYISTPPEHPADTHVRLARLDGGSPKRLGELAGPVSQIAWSPSGETLAAVVRVGAPDPTTQSAAERNGPRRVKGLAPRLDGFGWQDGRRQIFLVEVADGSARQLTRGEYDSFDPAFSPDGKLISFCSDRHRARDDRQFRADLYVTSIDGGAPRRLTDQKGRACFPSFSPDGALICYGGVPDADNWDEDSHLFVVPPDGSAPPERVSPKTDRGVEIFPGLPVPYRWLGNRELVVLVADRGAITIHRASLSRATSSEIVGGDRQVFSLAVSPRRREVAFASGWADAPIEVYASPLGEGEVRRLSHMNDELVDEVELVPLQRASITRPDGTEVEYFTLDPAGAPRARRRRLPLHLEVHGGPHGFWPLASFLAFHQRLAAAGYLVCLPNPRGSTGYGQQFTSACTGDWGGEDLEDLLSCCDDLVEKGVADGSRMFVSGYSYGGFMTSWIVGHSDRFSAATAGAPVVDQLSFTLTTDIPQFGSFNMGGTPWSKPHEYVKRSPVSYLPQVTTPVLVVQFEGDVRVPIGQGEELYTGLRLLGKEAAFVRYPGGFHIVQSPSQLVDWAEQIVAWNGAHDKARRTR